MFIFPSFMTKEYLYIVLNTMIYITMDICSVPISPAPVTIGTFSLKGFCLHVNNK